MIEQFFSSDYIEETEAVSLLGEINEKYKEHEGYIFYKFPSVKEMDKPVITPDIFIASKSLGIVLIVVDTMSFDREMQLDKMVHKMESIDNYVFTTLLKNRSMKKDARSLKFNITTVGYCPNYETDINNDNIFNSSTKLIEYISKIHEESNEVSIEIIGEAIASLEAATAIIKPKERLLEEKDKDTKAQILKIIETQIARFDDEQRISALSLLNGPQRIRGLAGSGKTIILCLKAAYLHLLYPDAIILYTFYTKSLYDYIIQLTTRFYMKMTDGQLPDFENKIKVMHAWGGTQIPGVYYNACYDNGISPINYGQAKRFGNAFEYICTKFVKDTKYNANKMYDYVLLDEAQDFDSSFYQLCRSIVKNDNLIWCYDEVQNIFDVILQNTKETFKNEFDNNGIDLLEETRKHPKLRNDIVLHKSYRNVRKILLVAVSLGFGIYNEKLIQSLESNEHWEDLGFRVLEGDCSKEELVTIERKLEASPLVIDESIIKDCILIYEGEKFSDELDYIANEIEIAIKNDKLMPEDIAVICLDEGNAFNYFDGLERRLASKSISTYNVMDRNYVKGFYKEGRVTLSSVYKAKGNEAAMVFVVGCDIFTDKKDSRTMRNKIFTSFTRAKVWLRISGTGINSLEIIKKEIQQLIDNDNKFIFHNKPTHVLDKDWNERSEQYESEEAFYEELVAMSKKKGISVDRLLQIYAQKQKEDDKVDE